MHHVHFKCVPAPRLRYTYPRRCFLCEIPPRSPMQHHNLKKSLSSVISGPANDPDTTHFDPYLPSDLQNELLADSLDGHDSDDLSQIDHSGITVHNIIPDGNRVDLPALIISSSTDTYDDQELDTPHSTNVQESPNRVRFRSRVRIASGLNRHRHNSQQHHQNQSGIDYLSFSPASSVSGSPSSSISAPLRTHTDEQIGKPGWGTLGQRVSLFARGNMERRKLREQREQRVSAFKKFRGGDVIPYANTAEVNEQTPLIFSPPSRHRYLASNGTGHRDSDSAREDEACQISREVEMVFGSWPGRLANYHWWWWQMEPIICCRYLTDDEGQ